MASWQEILSAIPYWQSAALKMTALLAAGWMIHFMLQRANPRWRVLLWRGVSIGLLVLPLAEWVGPKLEVPITQPSPSIEPAPFPQAPAPFTTMGPLQPVPDYVPLSSKPLPKIEPALPAFSILEWAREVPWKIGFALWGLIVILLLVRWRLSARKLEKFLEETDPAPDPLSRLLEKVRHELGRQSQVALRLTPENVSPFLAGYLRPTIVIPERMTQEENARDLPSVLAHELAHLKSHDLFWTGALKAASILLWFHPLFWRVRNAHAAACEQVCDAVAANYIGDASVYSKTLARAALELLVDSPAVTGLPMIRTSEITRRLRNLKRGIRWGALSRKWVIPTSVLAFGAVGLVGSIAFVAASDKIKRPDEERGNAPLIAELPDGIQVEVVGITWNRREREARDDEWFQERTWWAPDGTLLESPPYSRPRTFSNEPNSYEFALRFTGGTEYSITTRTELSYYEKEPDIPLAPDGEELNSLRSYVTGSLQENRTQTGLTVRLAWGQWKTIHSLDNQDYGDDSSITSHESIVFTPPQQQGDRIRVEISHFYAEVFHRLLAVEESGASHVAKKIPAGRGLSLGRDIFEFQDIDRDAVERFEFQIRHMDKNSARISFKDLSLQPGQSTKPFIKYIRVDSQDIPPSGNDPERVGVLEQPSRELLIGDWVGGGAIIPIHHTFLADGTYRQEIPSATGSAYEGTWKLLGNNLIRSRDGQEGVVEITEFNQDFFKIKDSNGSTWGYHRVEKKIDRTSVLPLNEAPPSTEVGLEDKTHNGDKAEEAQVSVESDQFPENSSLNLRIVDQNGLPVENVRVGYQGWSSSWDTRWGFDGPRELTGSDGMISVDFFITSLKHMPRLLYALSEDQELVGLLEIGPNDLGQTLEMELHPACHVRGRITLSGSEIGGTETFTPQARVAVNNMEFLWYSTLDGEYEFLLPPGDYKMRALSIRTYFDKTTFTIESVSTELVLDILDLLPTRLVELEGQPAPELNHIKHWKNGRSVSLADLKGKVVLLGFWGYRSSIRDIAKLIELHESLADVEFEIIAIRDNSGGNIEELDEKFDMEVPFRIGIDSGGNTRIAGTELVTPCPTFAEYGIHYFPMYVLIGPEGTVLGQIQLIDDQRWLKKRIRNLLRIEVPKSTNNMGHAPKSPNRVASDIFPAAAQGDTKSVQDLLKGDPLLLGATNEIGETPLHIAAKNGHLEIVKLLLEQGAEVNAEDNDGKNAWYHAAFNHHMNIANLLVEHGASWTTDEWAEQWEPIRLKNAR